MFLCIRFRVDLFGSLSLKEVFDNKTDVICIKEVIFRKFPELKGYILNIGLNNSVL